jgi:hypothetical protein
MAAQNGGANGSNSVNWSEWQSWIMENKWGLAIIGSLFGFLYYRYRFCREDGKPKPPIYVSDFKPDPNYIEPPQQPMGYGVPAMQSVSWRGGNGLPMAMPSRHLN